jgi:hypothetical protein
MDSKIFPNDELDKLREIIFNLIFFFLIAGNNLRNQHLRSYKAYMCSIRKFVTRSYQKGIVINK